MHSYVCSYMMNIKLKHHDVTYIFYVGKSTKTKKQDNKTRGFRFRVPSSISLTTLQRLNKSKKEMCRKVKAYNKNNQDKSRQQAYVC